MIGYWVLAAVLAVSTAVPGAGSTGLMPAIMIILGASSEEELQEGEIERFEALERHPLDLNAASRGRLQSCGLFSAYQVASVLDYRARTGDILSFSELALVDGFNSELAEALKHFVVLTSPDAPGYRERKAVRQSVLLRAAVKSVGAKDKSVEGVSYGSGAGKYSISVGDKFEGNWSYRQSYGTAAAFPGTISLAYYGRRSQIIVGDFNARFGQGLALWSGMSMSGFSSEGSFRRYPGGFSVTNSWSAAVRGVAFETESGAWSFSSAVSFPGLRAAIEGSGKAVSVMPMLNLSRYGPNWQLGLTSFARFLPGSSPEGSVSVDWRVGSKNMSFFGELALEWPGAAFALCSGLFWTPAYGREYNVLARHYGAEFKGSFAGAPRGGSKVSDEDGIAFSTKGKWYFVCLDACVHPKAGTSTYKCVADLKRTFGNVLKFTPEFRPDFRWRPADSNHMRLNLRGDFRLEWREWLVSLRLDWLRCQGQSYLTYLEAGWLGTRLDDQFRFSIYGRWTLFIVDNWNDRIYAYERDVPGSFNVPAYYGRGWNASAVAALKYKRSNLNFRLSYLAYPWMATPKPSVLEFKLQYALDF